MRILWILILTAFYNICIAQEPEQEAIRQISSWLAEHAPEEEDLSELIEKLSTYLKQPINLNQTSEGELKELMFLSPLQINAFFKYLASNEKLIDVLELQAIPEFDPETVNRLLPFVTVSTNTFPTREIRLKHLLKTGNNDLLLRYSRVLARQKGYKNLPGSKYLGSADKVLLRYRYDYAEHLTMGLVMEKDAGEKILNRSAGLDHLSGNLALRQVGPFKKIVLGDYSLQFGQGLALWSGFGFGKGPDVTSVAAKDSGVKPYASTNESSFFRGMASTFSLGKEFDLSSFVSYRRLDASLKTQSDSSYGLTNIQTTGLHRTKTELKNRGSLGQVVYGVAIQHQHNQLDLGLLWYQSRYQYPFIKGSQPYEQADFTGKQLDNVAAHYNYTLNNIYIYGELAHSLGTGWAVINGAMVNLSRRLSAVLLYRRYSASYHSFFAKAVGEQSQAANEQGYYLGFNYNLFKHWIWSTYADYFKSPNARYRVDFPSEGYELFNQLVYKPNKNFKLSIRYKRELKQQNSERTTSDLQNVVKENYRIELYRKINRQYHFQFRAELAKYQKGLSKSYGLLLYQDFNYAPMPVIISGNIRLAYFNTSSYNSRIYAYEDDVLYGASSVNYSGKGFRSFVNLRWKIKRQLDFWMRYAILIYHTGSTIGSGLDEIEGHKKPEIKLQLRYQF